MRPGDLLLDYDRLDEVLSQQQREYRLAQPFPHVVIDDLLPLKAVRTLVSRFPTNVHDPDTGSEDVNMEGGKPAQYRKGFLSREGLVDIAFRRVYWELNNGPFIEFLEQLTGIDGLIGDPYLLGGGVHESLNGGFLRVHADFNRHGNLGLQRRLNVLFYLNESWQKTYGGELELWDEGLTACQASIAPVAGRCVIFNTTSTSWHGHPHPLRCPEGVSRKSIALYYYSHNPDEIPPHETLWQELPGEL